MNSTGRPDASGPPWHGTARTWGRRLIAGAILVFIIFVAFMSVKSDWVQVCSVVPAEVGTEGTARVCRPPSLTDPLVLLSVLLFVVLLLPDVSKIGIPGLLELERQVEVQQVRTDSLERLVMSQHVTIYNSMGAPADVLPDDTVLAGTAGRITEKEAEFFA